MLVAPARPRTPEGDWQTILGARFLFAPIDRPMLMRARRAAREASQGEDADEPGSPIDMIEEMGDAMSRALITEGMKDWDDVAIGVADDDGEPVLQDGEPTFEALPFTPENLALILSDPVTFEAIDNAYVVPFILRERERAEPGNVSSASPAGTGAKAEMQPSDTATSPASLKAADGAASAPTSSKSPSRRKRRTSGAS